MSRTSELLAVLTDDPASTQALYDRIGYATLVRLGLVAYPAFRTELARLAAEGLAESATADDGSTTWRLPRPPEEAAGDPPPPASS